jgi:Putative peptidoglycan binding domain
MSNLFRSLSLFIGGHADAGSASSRVQPATEVAPAPQGNAHSASSAAMQMSPSPSSTLDLPMVAYVPPRAQEPSARPRRSRAVSLLRSAGATPITSRTVPALAAACVLPHTAHATGPVLTETERVRLQVMQAQIQLSALHLYEGPIDGHMNAATVKAVRYFQTLKGMRPSGMLAVGTLAALGVPLIA